MLLSSNGLRTPRYFVLLIFVAAGLGVSDKFLEEAALAYSRGTLS